MRKLAQILGLIAAITAVQLFTYYAVIRPGELGAADANRVFTLERDATGTGSTTRWLGTVGGWASYQVTCSTAGAATWPDSVTLQARDDDAHAWVIVDGFTASTADERQGIFWFARGSEVRAVIADAAGSHSCTATLAFGSFRDY